MHCLLMSAILKEVKRMQILCHYNEKSKAVAQWCSVKKLYLETAKFTTVACSFIKKDILAKVFAREFCEISKNTFYCRTPLMAASEKRSVKNKGLNIIILQCPDEKSVVENADCQKFSDKQNIAQGKLPKP